MYELACVPIHAFNCSIFTVLEHRGGIPSELRGEVWKKVIAQSKKCMGDNGKFLADLILVEKESALFALGFLFDILSQTFEFHVVNLFFYPTYVCLWRLRCNRQVFIFYCGGP